MIPATEDTLLNLVTFDLVTLRLFVAVAVYYAALMDLLYLIDSLDEFHTEVQGVITSPLISTTLLFNTSHNFDHLKTCA